METKGYYAAVGFFVIVFLSIGLIIGLWLSVGVSTKSYHYYIIYIKESVAGLSVSAPVKYNGVDVGAVKKMALNAQNPNQVESLVAVEENTPITTATRATLNMQGLTGIAYIALFNDKEVEAKPLSVQPGQKYPVIKSSPSLLTRMDVAVEHMADSFHSIVESINTVFNQKNGELFQDTLSNINAITGNLKENNDRLNRILKNLDISTEKMPALMNNASQGMEQFKQVSLEANSTIQTINNELLPLFINVFGNIDGLTLRLDDFTQQLSDNPSLLIRGQAPLPLGPGETSSAGMKTRN